MEGVDDIDIGVRLDHAYSKKFKIESQKDLCNDNSIKSDGNENMDVTPVCNEKKTEPTTSKKGPKSKVSTDVPNDGTMDAKQSIENEKSKNNRNTVSVGNKTKPDKKSAKKAKIPKVLTNMAQGESNAKLDSDSKKVDKRTENILRSKRKISGNSDEPSIKKAAKTTTKNVSLSLVKKRKPIASRNSDSTKPAGNRAVRANNRNTELNQKQQKVKRKADKTKVTVKEITAATHVRGKRKSYAVNRTVNKYRKSVEKKQKVPSYSNRGVPSSLIDPTNILKSRTRIQSTPSKSQQKK